VGQGVVVHHRDPSPLAEHLEAPRHPGEALAGGGEAVKRDLQLEADRERGERVAHVVQPEQRQPHRPQPAARRALDREARAARIRHDLGRAQVQPAGAVPQRPPPQPRASDRAPASSPHSTTSPKGRTRLAKVANAASRSSGPS
jgi:hypothetical protein